MDDLTEEQKQGLWKTDSEMLERNLIRELKIYPLRSAVTPQRLDDWLLRLRKTLPAALGFDAPSDVKHDVRTRVPPLVEERHFASSLLVRPGIRITAFPSCLRPA